MNTAYLLEKGIKKLVSKYGQSGAISKITGAIGSKLAGVVVRYVVQGKTTAAVAALGGKIGALAGPIGIVLGVTVGVL